MRAPFLPLLLLDLDYGRSKLNCSKLTYFSMGVTGSQVLLTKSMGFFVAPPKGPELTLTWLVNLSTHLRITYLQIGPH
jgi:hypothetical protein